MTQFHHAGYSDKYGRVKVERYGSTPIASDEPVALFRATDRFSTWVLAFYLLVCFICRAPKAHRESVNRQLDNFERWQAVHKTRTPGKK